MTNLTQELSSFGSIAKLDEQNAQSTRIKPVVADHRLALVLGKARNHRADVSGVAAATAAEADCGQRPHLVLVME